MAATEAQMIAEKQMQASAMQFNNQRQAMLACEQALMLAQAAEKSSVAQFNSKRDTLMSVTLTESHSETTDLSKAHTSSNGVFAKPQNESGMDFNQLQELRQEKQAEPSFSMFKR